MNESALHAHAAVAALRELEMLHGSLPVVAACVGMLSSFSQHAEARAMMARSVFESLGHVGLAAHENLMAALAGMRSAAEGEEQRRQSLATAMAN